MYVSSLPTLCLRSLDGIPVCVLPHFHKAAEQLIKEKGATNVVSAALAYISGAKEMVSSYQYTRYVFFLYRMFEINAVNVHVNSDPTCGVKFDVCR